MPRTPYLTGPVEEMFRSPSSTFPRNMLLICRRYKIFSSWFPPSHGFAATLGLELGIGKVMFPQIIHGLN
jgi:hypothetical protein